MERRVRTNSEEALGSLRPEGLIHIFRVECYRRSRNRTGK